MTKIFAKLYLGSDVRKPRGAEAPHHPGDMVEYIRDPDDIGDCDVRRGQNYEVINCEWNNHGDDRIGHWYVVIKDDKGDRNMLYSKTVRSAKVDPPTEAGAREYEEIMSGLDLIKIKI